MLWNLTKLILFLAGFVWTIYRIVMLRKDIRELREYRKAYLTRNDPEILKWEAPDDPVLLASWQEDRERQYKAMLITYVYVFWPLTALYMIWFLIVVF